MNNDLELWQKAIEVLRGVLPLPVFSNWIEPVTPVSIQNNCFILNVTNDYYQLWLEKNYKSYILDALRVAGAPVDLAVRFDVVAPNPSPKPEPRPEPPKKPRPKVNNVSTILMNPLYTFENFVTGPSNSFAHAAAIAVSKSPAQAHNPLFIHGPTGLGKTHLMQAIGHQILTRPGMSVCYVSSETMLNEYIEALKNRTMVDFRNRYRRADVLLVDDIQFFCGKGSIQEEFFHTFDALHSAHKQIIMTSDLPPADLKDLEPRLLSRFGWGMVTGIENPDFETRLAILRYKNSLANVHLREDILTFIANHIQSNVRCLEGALTRTSAFVTLHENPAITIDEVRKVLKDLLNDERQKDITYDEIQRAVVSHFGLRMTDMSSEDRTRTLATPRQVAMFLCRKLTRLSLSEIAQTFGKTHATVVHASKTIQDRIQVENDLLDSVQHIVKTLGRDSSSIS